MLKGYKRVYRDGSRGHSAENTHCAACGKLLMERMDYQVVQYHLNGSCCDYCGYSIATHF